MSKNQNSEELGINIIIWGIAFPLLVIYLIIQFTILYYILSGKDTYTKYINQQSGYYQMVGKTLIYHPSKDERYKVINEDKIKVIRLKGEIEFQNK